MGLPTDTQYDETPKERRLVEERARIRSELRAHYVKQWTNPHRMTLDGGYIFDPSLQRWMSLRAQQWHYFKPTPKTLYYPLLVIVSIGLYGYAFFVSRRSKDTAYRRGEVSYADRDFKFK